LADTAAIILAAGKSTRMKSEAPKVLHHVCGKPMLWYVINACREAGVGRLVVVVGHRKDDVIAEFSGQNDITFVEQVEQKGTGHAAMVCADALHGFSGQVLVIAGDMPLIGSATLSALLDENARTRDAVTLATCMLDDPTSYGRIVRDEHGELAGIVEHNDCTDEQRAIREVNVSYYCYDGSRMFELLSRVPNDNAKGEYYITDTIKLSLAAGMGAGAVAAVPAEDAMGVNSRADLAVVSRLMQQRIARSWMDSGVTIVEPLLTWIETGASIGPETVIHPFSYVAAGATIGAGSTIGPHAHVSGRQAAGPGSVIGATTANEPEAAGSNAWKAGS